MLRAGVSGRAAAMNTRATGNGVATPKVGKGERAPRPENVAGSFYVDHTCIDCDTCRWMCPSVFTRDNELSAVYKQPEGDAETVRAYQALLSCPTYSIHSTDSHPKLSKEARDGMPTPVQNCPNVYHCGWHAENTFGGASWFIVRNEGNILIDSPRFNPVLAKHIEALGGIKYMFLTHRDDVGDQALWHKRFQCRRIIHEIEVNSRTRDVEIRLDGEGPWKLEDGSDDVELIYTPGHTKGHVCLYYKPSKALLSGDHLEATLDGHGLEIDEYHNWYDIPLQLDSVKKLARYDFLHVLPGHGRPLHLENDAQRVKAFDAFTESNGLAEVAFRSVCSG